jgi:hypothetical protein
VVSGTIALPIGKVGFHGTLAGAKITGTLDLGGLGETFTVEAVPPALRASFDGTYNAAGISGILHFDVDVNGKDVTGKATVSGALGLNTTGPLTATFDGTKVEGEIELSIGKTTFSGTLTGTHLAGTLDWSGTQGTFEGTVSGGI